MRLTLILTKVRNPEAAFNVIVMPVTALFLDRFVFIMGTSMAISMRSLMRRATSRPKLALRVCKRTLILFAIGVCMNSMKRGRK